MKMSGATSESWQVGKTQTVSKNGMVACQHWQAAKAGARVLSAGGNAVDAAVVTALVLSVVEPWLSGIGGGGFLLRADGASGTVDVLDFNVVSPAGLDPADYGVIGGNDEDWFSWPAVEGDRNLIGYGSICVPGTIAGLAEALEKFGTISWEEALAPAIEQAKRGLQVDWYAALALAIDGHNLARFPSSAALFLKDGRAPRVPEGGKSLFLPMAAKAATLERLARAGARDFYEGEIASTMVADLASGGSALSATDLSAYCPRWMTSQAQVYQGSTIHAVPGLSGGPTLLKALFELETTLTSADPLSGETALAFARALQHANDDRYRRLGHAAGQSCTSHISVVDRDGTMVSLTNTLLSRFGSKVVVPELGFLLNNGMMWFDPRPGRPNSLAAGRQPLANMSPVIAIRNGKPELALGAAGGRQIVSAVAQILAYVLAYGLSPEKALSSPRIDVSGAAVRVNSAAASDVAALVSAEYDVQMIEDTLYPVNFAIPSLVLCRDGLNIGMVHPRNPWAAVGEATP
ncbi:gamma-glutamyltransferase [Neorhizobium sp. NCHU2750]|uniref:gamma-glutamyltransferase family protein n=1 Tax=Neorhizobium sp. NCHU2750 TaxID=1825976 RepID=UPI000EB6270D|nr:gamma-glutamyltranspeptidase [Neorhizobium sp. NCHU2750]